MWPAAMVKIENSSFYSMPFYGTIFYGTPFYGTPFYGTPFYDAIQLGRYFTAHFCFDIKIARIKIHMPI